MEKRFPCLPVSRWRFFWRQSSSVERTRLVVLLVPPASLLVVLPGLTGAWCLGLLLPFWGLARLVRFRPQLQKALTLSSVTTGLLGLWALDLPYSTAWLGLQLGVVTALPVALASDPLAKKQQLLQRELAELESRMEHCLETIRRN